MATTCAIRSIDAPVTPDECLDDAFIRSVLSHVAMSYLMVKTDANNPAVQAIKNLINSFERKLTDCVLENEGKRVLSIPAGELTVPWDGILDKLMEMVHEKQSVLDQVSSTSKLQPLQQLVQALSVLFQCKIVLNFSKLEDHTFQTFATETSSKMKNILGVSIEQGQTVTNPSQYRFTLRLPSDEVDRLEFLQQLKKFVFHGVQNFEEKLEQYLRMASGKLKKRGKWDEALGKFPGKMVGVIVGIVSSNAGAGASAGEAAGSISDKLLGEYTYSENQARATAIMRLFADYVDNRDKYRQLLIEFFVNVCQNYESQLSLISAKCQDLDSMIDQLSQECTSRVFNHIADHDKSFDIRANGDYESLRGFLLQGSVSGKSKQSAFKEVALVLQFLRIIDLAKPGFKMVGLKETRSGDFFKKSNEFKERTKYKPWIGVDIDYKEIFDSVTKKLLQDVKVTDARVGDIPGLASLKPMQEQIQEIHAWQKGFSVPKNSSNILPLDKWWPNEMKVLSTFVERRIDGRPLELCIRDHLPSHLDESGRVVICGMGGSGKTTAATWYAVQAQSLYDHIIWMRSEGEVVTTTSFKSLGHDLNLEKSESYPAFEDFIRKVYQKLDRVKCLFIFDNAIRYSDTTEEAGLRKFLPKDPKHHVVITSSKRTWGNVNEGEIQALQLGVFSEEECEQYFRKTLGKNLESKFETMEEFLILAKLIQRLPLALEIAAAAIPYTDLTIDKYTGIIKKDLDQLLVNIEILDNYEHTLRAALKRSIQFLRADKRIPVGELCNTLMIIAAYCDPDAIPETLFLQLNGVKENNVKLALKGLADYSLLQLQGLDENTRLFGMHRLLQHVIRSSQEQREIVSSLYLALRSFQHFDTLLYFIHFSRMWTLASKQFRKSKVSDLSTIQLKLVLIDIHRQYDRQARLASLCREMLQVPELGLGPLINIVRLHVKIIKIDWCALQTPDNHFLKECETALQEMVELKYNERVYWEGKNVQLYGNFVHREKCPNLSLQMFIVVFRAVCVFYTKTTYANNPSQLEDAAKEAAEIIVKEVYATAQCINILAVCEISQLVSSEMRIALFSCFGRIPLLFDFLKKQSSDSSNTFRLPSFSDFVRSYCDSLLQKSHTAETTPLDALKTICGKFDWSFNIDDDTAIDLASELNNMITHILDSSGQHASLVQMLAPNLTDFLTLHAKIKTDNDFDSLLKFHKRYSHELIKTGNWAEVNIFGQTILQRIKKLNENEGTFFGSWCTNTLEGRSDVQSESFYRYEKDFEKQDGYLGIADQMLDACYMRMTVGEFELAATLSLNLVQRLNIQHIVLQFNDEHPKDHHSSFDRQWRSPVVRIHRSKIYVDRFEKLLTVEDVRRYAMEWNYFADYLQAARSLVDHQHPKDSLYEMHCQMHINCVVLDFLTRTQCNLKFNDIQKFFSRLLISEEELQKHQNNQLDFILRKCLEYWSIGPGNAQEVRF